MTTMRERFLDDDDDDDGLRRLRLALLRQPAVRHDDEVAQALIDAGEVIGINSGELLIEQSDAASDVFFILAGEADVEVNGRVVARRSEGTHVGEMAAINPGQRRSASVRAKDEVVVLRVGEPALSDVADRFPFVWREFALELADRLRERNRFHQNPNDRPRLFIGCSVEALDVARGIQDGLHHDGVDVTVWSDGVFGASDVTMDRLVEEVQRSDFAIFVLSPDDQVVTRDATADVPRDNVILELGLFMGRLGRERVFAVKPQGVNVKVPTDLLGITCPTYDADRVATDPQAATATATNSIRHVVRDLGSF